MTRLFCISITGFFFLVANVFSQTLSKSEQQRLLSFGELYSMVKYYYPDPNLQDFPWDAFAYQGYQLAKNTKNDKEFVQKIDSLFKMIAPGVQISNKKFELARIIPKDSALYSERAFWQHRGGLSTEKPSSKNASTLNYIYKKSENKYGTWIYLPLDREKYSRKTRLSVWIKTENVTDSITVFYFTAIAAKVNNVKGAKDSRFEIKALNNEWKQYFIEFTPADSVAISQLYFGIAHPPQGNVYVDDLKIEVYNNGVWETVDVPNANFEQYNRTGLRFWEELYVDGLTVADSINAIEGKYCLKLPAVQEQILYSPQPLNKPYAVSLPEKYFAYVPLQLYANDTVVCPVTDKTEIKHFAQKIKTEQNNLPIEQQAIAWNMQIWAALYQDYPYRDSDFENRINNLLVNVINKLQEEGYKNITNIPFQEFLLWINDPHARIWFEATPKQINRKTLIRVPVESIELTETQCVIKEVADSMIQRGDIILRIDNVDIDSLLQVYRNHNISRNLQGASVFKILTSTDKPELTMTVKRENEIIPLLFTRKTNQSNSLGDNFMKQQTGKKIAETLRDSLKQKNLFYIDCETYTHRALSIPLFSPEQEETRKMALDSLVMEINNYAALILDARGERGTRTMPLLHALNERYGIDISKKRYVTKIAFSPVAQFQKDTTNNSLEEKRNIAITVPIYVLVDLYTHSAPELTLLNLKESGKATFIGSNTSGAAGYQSTIQIADNIFLYYTSGQLVGLDNNPMSFQGIGIPPDIYVYPTPQGIAEGRDEVLEKAVEIALKNAEKK